MPIFHLNIVYDNEILMDHQGSTFPHIASAKAEAYASLCFLAAEDVSKGERIRVRQVDVVSADNETHHTVTLGGAIAGLVPFDDDGLFFELAEGLRSLTRSS